MEHKNTLNNNSKNKENERNKKSIDGDGYMGVPVHSQVIKIKKEIDKIKHPSLQQPEMRPVYLLRGFTRQRSPSPLGLAERPISVGNS